jgi:polar amino acid transport system substrate-binding protein
VNQGLTGIKADGTYQAIYAKYFGTAPTGVVAGTAASAAASAAPK